MQTVLGVFDQNRFHLVVSNTLAQIFGKLISGGLTFIGLAFIARRYGPSGLGEYTLVLTYIGFFYLFVDAGFNAIVVREVIENSNQLGLKLRFLMGTRFIWALTLIFAGLVIIAFLPYSTIFKLGVAVMSLSILLQAGLVSLNAFFQARLTYLHSAVAAIIGSLVTCVLTLVVVFLGLSIFWLFPSVGLGLAVSVTLAYFLASGLGLKIKPQFSWSEFRGLVLTSLPLSLTLALNVIAFKVDVFILAYLINVDQVGWYNLAYRVFENVITIPTFALNALYPILVFDRTQSLAKLWELARRSAVVLLGLSGILALILIISAPLVVSILGGPGFLPSVSLLRILLIGLPFFFLSSLVMWLLITLKKTWWLVGVYTLGLVANLLLNVWLIPRFGATAAAVNTGLTEVVILLCGGLALARLRRLSQNQIIGQPGLASKM